MKSHHNDISLEIALLHEKDQEDRKGLFDDVERTEKMWKNDVQRLARAHEIYAGVQKGDIILSPESFYLLAMLFQHSSDAPDHRRAQALAQQSADGGYDKGKWLAAAAEDRYLLTIGRKQKWGTQFKKEKDGEWEQSAMESDSESGVTDEMRKVRAVPERNEQLAHFLRKQSAWESKSINGQKN